jgi:hypothetical protein
MSTVIEPLSLPNVYINGSDVKQTTKLIETHNSEGNAIFTNRDPIVIAAPVSITMDWHFPEAEIRYTFNGKSPNLKSKLVTRARNGRVVPIVLTENKTGGDTTVLKAKVFFEGRTSGTYELIIRVV